MSEDSPPSEKIEMQKLIQGHTRMDWTEACRRVSQCTWPRMLAASMSRLFKEEHENVEKEDKEDHDKEKHDKKNTKRRPSHKSGHDGKAAHSNKQVSWCNYSLVIG